ncbi:MAG: hypothetical protein PHN38_06420 [Sulfurospirillaceae bacterium]|nr:hypothetical protein [Sulfurospirillaceae bacterium]MDD3462484.1 hypothetical protein [Sulfurospirillaceae bacterium]
MRYPDFFDTVESIVVKDELSAILGAFEDGIIEFTYLDIVKSAGHSCPTIAGAYLCAREGLKALFGKNTPVRGEINVFFKNAQNEGVTGVIANVFSQITGATSDWGFKGLGGEFDRRFLLHFNSDIPLHVRISKANKQEYVDIDYNPNAISSNPKLQPLMQKVLSKQADESEKVLFSELWQEKVKIILENSDKVLLVKK